MKRMAAMVGAPVVLLVAVLLLAMGGSGAEAKNPPGGPSVTAAATTTLLGAPAPMPTLIEVPVVSTAPSIPPSDTIDADTTEFIEANDYGTPISNAVIGCLGTPVVVGLIDTELGSFDFDVLDEGHSVIMSGVNIFDPSLSTGFEAYDCVRGALGLPEWTSEVMNRTTSLSGLVSVEVGDYTVMWSYHPDNGPLVVVYDEEAA
jgi:hypothetical protein